MQIIEKTKNFYRKAAISTKITFTYATCFIMLILLMNFGLWYGVSYALYHPAETTIEYSLEKVKELLVMLEEDENYVSPNILREPLVAGVVLRVFDKDGGLFIDSDPTYLSNENFDFYKLKDKPFLANRNFDIAKVGNALVYRARFDYIHDDDHVILYFYRTITSMSNIFEQLSIFLICLDIFGLIGALKVGNFVSRKILMPISTMTNLAQKIAYNKIDSRISIPPADDELSMLAKTLNAMLDRLQGGITQQQKFVSDASHELRTPTTVISGYIDILDNYGSEDDSLRIESVDAIRSEVENMKRLLENFLFISRTDQNRQKIYKTQFDIAEVVSEVMRKMQISIHTHKILLLKNDSAQIYADRTMILQLLRIFLDNATKYTPSGGTISVSSELVGDKVKIEISDTGIGIAQENLEKIFERLVRIDSEDLVKDVRGSGLGLSIAKWIADNHNIKIEVESKLGKGTTFKLTLDTVAKNF